MGMLSSKWHFEPPHKTRHIKSVLPLWSPPPTNHNIGFQLSKYTKEYISTTLLTSAQGYSLAVDTSGRKLILRSDDNILGMAKRFGMDFRIFSLKPNYEGQQPCSQLRRANDAPLYFHSTVKIEEKGKELVYCVFRLGNQEETHRIESGPRNSFEKTCIEAASGDELAFWKYYDRLNHVDVFRNDESSKRDVGLMVLLVIIADLFDGDVMLMAAGEVAAASLG